MIYNIDTLEEEFSKLLQSNISVTINGKVLRSGRLVLFSIKNFYLTFSISRDTEPTRLIYYELPVPFFYEVKKKSIVLSYKMRLFHQNDPDVLIPIQMLNKSKLHKIHDKDVVITVNN